MYYTRAEYDSLMLEAIVEYKQWLKDRKKNKKAPKQLAIRKAIKEARKVFKEA